MTNVEGGNGGVQGPVNGGPEQYIGGPVQGPARPGAPIEAGTPVSLPVGEQAVGPTTGWNPDSRTLQRSTMYPVARNLRFVLMDLGAENLSVARDEANPRLEHTLVVHAPSPDAAEEIASRHGLSVTASDSNLVVESSYVEGIYTSESREPGGDISFVSEMSFGETGGVIINNVGDEVVVVGRGGEVTVDGVPVDEVPDSGVVYEDVHESLALFVPKGNIEYDLTTEEGAMEVHGVNGTLGVTSERGRLEVEDFEGTVDANVTVGSIRVRRTTFLGDSELHGGNIDLEVKNEDLRVEAESVWGGITVPEEGFTVEDKFGENDSLGKLPREVTGYFGGDPAPTVEVDAIHDIKLAQSPQNQE